MLFKNWGSFFETKKGPGDFFVYTFGLPPNPGFKSQMKIQFGIPEPKKRNVILVVTIASCMV